jgi:hypothetical protein
MLLAMAGWTDSVGAKIGVAVLPWLVLAASVAGCTDSTASGSGDAATDGIVELSLALVIAPQRLAFGAEPVGSAGSPRSVKVSAVRPEAVIPTPTVVLSSPDFRVTANECTSPLAAGDSCTIATVFEPHGLGQRTGTLEVASGQIRAAIPLEGTGL